MCPDFASLLDNVPTEQLAQAAQDADAFEALYQQLIAQQPDEGTAVRWWMLLLTIGYFLQSVYC